MRSRRKGRELAVKLLYGFDVLPRKFGAALNEFWALTRYPQDVREFADHLVRGTLTHQQEIDTFIIQNAINWSLERMAVVDRNILRFAVYELLYEPDIPPKVTINEALDISKKYSTPKSSAFINGILDHIHQTLNQRQSSRLPGAQSETHENPISP